MVSRLVPSDWVRIIEVDRVREEFKFKAGFENGGVLEDKIVPFASTSLTEVVDTRTPEYIADLRRVDSPLKVERELSERGYVSHYDMALIYTGLGEKDQALTQLEKEYKSRRLGLRSCRSGIQIQHNRYKSGADRTL